MSERTPNTLGELIDHRQALDLLAARAGIEHEDPWAGQVRPIYKEFEKDLGKDLIDAAVKAMG